MGIFVGFGISVLFIAFSVSVSILISHSLIVLIAWSASLSTIHSKFLFFSRKYIFLLGYFMFYLIAFNQLLASHLMLGILECDPHRHLAFITP